MKHLDFKTAQKMLMDHVHPVQTERLPLSLCGGRILAEDLLAVADPLAAAVEQVASKYT